MIYVSVQQDYLLGGDRRWSGVFDFCPDRILLGQLFPGGGAADSGIFPAPALRMHREGRRGIYMQQNLQGVKKMELAIHKETLRYLRQTRYDQLCQEQTAELTVPETMPEIGRIVDCFGLVTVQSKTAENGAVTVNGGIQAGVLYVPQGEQDTLQRIDAYLPFTVTKKVTVEEGTTLFYWGWLRSMDARFINSRKLFVRANLSSELTLLAPEETELCRLETVPAGLERRTACYPLQLPLCAAEKELQIADELLMPEEAAGADRLLKWSCGAEITDTAVIGEKAVFKGNIRLRVLYASEDGQLAAWEGVLPFSQYAELETEPKNPVVTVQPLFRHVEIDTDGQIDSHRLLINLTMTAQILVLGELQVELTEDAYYLGGELTPEWQSCTWTPCLDRQQRSVTEEVPLPEEAAGILDWTLFPDSSCPGARGHGDLNPNLLVNVLYYDGDRALQGKTLRQPIKTGLQADGETEVLWGMEYGWGVQPQSGSLRIPIRLNTLFLKQLQYRNLQGGKLTPRTRRDAPSLVVRQGTGDLWDLAKENGSTVEAIQSANELDTDVLKEEQLLLIPSGQMLTAGEDQE